MPFPRETERDLQDGINYLELLGVSPDASPVDIMTGFRRRLRAVHPDTAGSRADAAEDIARLLRAKHTLLGVDRLTYVERIRRLSTPRVARGDLGAIFHQRTAAREASINLIEDSLIRQIERLEQADAPFSTYVEVERDYREFLETFTTETAYDISVLREELRRMGADI